MADSKITALTSISTSTDPANDPLVIVDVSDTSMAATGTTKKVTLNQLLGASGTATLASATITGDLTVDTSTLKVDSANNRVGIGTASPGNALHVQSTGDIARFTNGTNSAYLAIDSAGYTFFTGAGQTGNGFYAKATTNAVQLWTNGAQRYDIDSTGVSTWSVGGSTAMTLNATGLGVGGSPVSGNKLFVEGSAQIGSSSTAGTNRLTIDGLGTVGNVPTIRFRSAGAAKAYVGLSGAYLGDTSTDLLLTTDAAGAAVKFGSSDTGTVKMTLDASGNLLVGLTTAGTTAAKTIQIANGTAPTANVSGGQLYVEAGALKYRGSSGTVTTIANA